MSLAAKSEWASGSGLAGVLNGSGVLIESGCGHVREDIDDGRRRRNRLGSWSRTRPSAFSDEVEGESRCLSRLGWVREGLAPAECDTHSLLCGALRLCA